MRSLHVWLLTGVLAAAACKPAVRDGSGLQSGGIVNERDTKIHDILVWAGVAAGAGLGVIFGVKKWSTIKELPGKSASMIKGYVSDIGKFLPLSNRVSRGEFNKVFAKGDWEDKFGLPFDSKARSALIDHLSIRRSDAIKAVNDGKSVDAVLDDDSFRILKREDLTARLNDIYKAKIDSKALQMESDDLAPAIENMIKKVQESDLQPSRLKKRLEKTADKVAAEAQTAS